MNKSGAATVKLDIPALLPCPFCGDDALITQSISEPHLFTVGCSDCWCTIDCFYQDKTDAITAWNTRSLTTALEIGRAMGREEAAKVSEKFAASYANAAKDDDNRSESYRSRCKEAGEVLLFIATAIRSTAHAVDLEGLTERAAEAIYLHERPTMYAIEAGTQPWTDLTDYARDLCRAKARAVLSSLGLHAREN